ncbi:LysR family transcriptional regulator [Chelativorans sp. AA-79]|uniref:LysR family transcriptional regulator n=1 Tax=Chelativorans sp. AA-79 TaxID=3028735 RepID=UPI0023F9DF8D|nr:LysR family transcriptional regulator [Chelativorans sp. AA-79]WEX08253.1 LysR family transcriptional regulator [Chelativorans sp. AA-79]
MSLERLSLGTIRCVREVLASRSVTVAAERIGISQSAVSQQVARFEKLSGIPIIARNGTKMTVCSDEIARLIFAMMEPVETMRCISLGKEMGKLRLGLCDYLAARHCSNISRYMDLDKEFEIRIGRPSGVAGMFNDGELDIVMRPLFHHEGEVDLMVDVPLVWVASHAFGPRLGDGRSAPIPVVLEATLSPYSYYAERSLREAQIPYKVAGRADDNLVRMHLVSAGLGCTTVPKFALDTLPAHAIRAVAGITGKSCIRFGMFYNKKKVQFKKACRIFEAISEYMV